MVGIYLEEEEKLSPISDVLVIVYSSLLALFITIGVSAYFRYRLPPISEQIFANNRNSFLKMTFDKLETFDEFLLKRILETFTKEFGELKRERKEILKNTFKFVPIDELENQETMDFVESMKENTKLQELRKNFALDFENMRKVHKNFIEDRTFYEKYFHHSFIRDIDQYFWQTNYYVEWLFKNVIISGCMDDRKNNAEKIIDYIQSDKTIDKNSENVRNFMNKWNLELKKGY